jgi:hypothetical protein
MGRGARGFQCLETAEKLKEALDLKRLQIVLDHAGEVVKAIRRLDPEDGRPLPDDVIDARAAFGLGFVEPSLEALHGPSLAAPHPESIDERQTRPTRPDGAEVDGFPRGRRTGAEGRVPDEEQRVAGSRAVETCAVSSRRPPASSSARQA